MIPIEVTVNQRRHRKLVVPRTSLADFLRDEIGLTGTHLGCEHGICGACTVLIDGQMSRSCITYAISCDGATVETIEGLDDDPVMKELRRAFSEEHALQCGYCTPGMLITARDILSRYKTPTTVQIRHELSGNLCRCTGYRGIVRAIARVAELSVTGVHPEHAPGLGPAPGPQAGSAQTESTARDVVTQDSTAMPVMQSAAATPSDIAVNVSETTLSDGWVSIAQTFTLPHPRTEVWPLMSNLEDVCSALPGIELDGPPVDGVVSGNASISLGPIRPVFAFSGSHTVDTEGYTTKKIRNQRSSLQIDRSGTEGNTGRSRDHLHYRRSTGPVWSFRICPESHRPDGLRLCPECEHNLVRRSTKQRSATWFLEPGVKVADILVRYFPPKKALNLFPRGKPCLNSVRFQAAIDEKPGIL